MKKGSAVIAVPRSQAENLWMMSVLMLSYL